MSHCTLTVSALAERVLAQAEPEFREQFVKFQQELRADVEAEKSWKASKEVAGRPHPKLQDEVILQLSALLRKELSATGELVSLYGYGKTLDGLHFAPSARRVILHLSEDFGSDGLEGMTHRQDWTNQFLGINIAA